MKKSDTLKNIPLKGFNAKNFNKEYGTNIQKDFFTLLTFAEIIAENDDEREELVIIALNMIVSQYKDDFDTMLELYLTILIKAVSDSYNMHDKYLNRLKTLLEYISATFTAEDNKKFEDIVLPIQKDIMKNYVADKEDENKRCDKLLEALKEIDRELGMINDIQKLKKRIIEESEDDEYDEE